MKKENMSTLAYAVIGVIGLIAGIAAGKYQEKRLEEEIEAREKEREYLTNYVSVLGEATEVYKNEIDEMCALADDVLAYIEESEKDLYDEEEL